MPNPENIIEHNYKPGDEWNGNKSGRPKGSRNVSTMLKQLLEQLDKEKFNGNGDYGNPLAMKLMEMIFGKGHNDNVRMKAITEAIDRIDGKPVQSIDLGLEKMQGRFIEPPVQEEIEEKVKKKLKAGKD